MYVNGAKASAHVSTINTTISNYTMEIVITVGRKKWSDKNTKVPISIT